tara:strand:- start:29 stop:310 length:282 start_codon:yes stop_codon:yes gene_type:complete
MLVDVFGTDAILAAVGAKLKVMSPGLNELIFPAAAVEAFPVGTGRAQQVLNFVPSVGLTAGFSPEIYVSFPAEFVLNPLVGDGPTPSKPVTPV